MKLAILACLIVVTLCGSVADADESARQIDLSPVLKDPHGEPYTDCVPKEDKSGCERYVEVTLGSLALAALDSGKNDGQITAFKLMEAIAHAKMVELSAADTKTLVDSLWGLRTTVQSRGGNLSLYEIGQAVKMIDPASLK